MSHTEHHAEAPARLTLGVLTLSDTRNESTDESGRLLRERLTAAGHAITQYAVIREDPTEMRTRLTEWLALPLDAIVTNGGTGLTARDGTIEVARSLLDKELPGFGELFRLLSFHQIGPAAMLSRATAGLARGKILVCLPGSRGAVGLALERILIPELAHMVREARR